MESKEENRQRFHDSVIELKTSVNHLKVQADRHRRRTDIKLENWGKAYDRIIDLQLDNYDKIVELLIFFLKILFPALAFSFTGAPGLIDINPHQLRSDSVFWIFEVVLALVLVFILRWIIVKSEEKAVFDSLRQIEDEITSEGDKILKEGEILHKQLEKTWKMENKLRTNGGRGLPVSEGENISNFH